jgi:uncharacterized protein
MANVRLFLLSDMFAICRLDPDAPSPTWAERSASGRLISITRTRDELSIVCAQEDIPEGVRYEGGWRCLMVEGPLDFSLTGVLSSLLAPLAEVGVSIFALSTFDTDYLLVRAAQLERAIEALRASGYQVEAADPTR